MHRHGARYPSDAPYHPAEHFPELPETGRSERNDVFAMVRQALLIADATNPERGRPGWNPLRRWIEPGQTVLVKPNLVKEDHPRDPAGWEYVLTHGSLIRAACDYAFLAVGAAGRVVVADAPQTDADFDAIAAHLGLVELQAHYAALGLELTVLDLRRERWRNERGVIVERRPLPGDPEGTVSFDLGAASELAGHRGSGSYYGADYDAEFVNDHHAGGRHEYLLSGTAVRCDAVLSLPKLKTHKKAGITLAMKNLVGVNGDKNYLPHHTEGPPSAGGDERPVVTGRARVERWGAARLRALALRMPAAGTRLLQQARALGTPVFGDTDDTVRSGNWWGNDTLWRMCLDLNKLISYGNDDGTLRPAGAAGRKPHLVLVDGVRAGEGNGPMNPDPVDAGLVLFGANAPSVDAAAAVLIGLDPDRVPIVRQAFLCREHPLAEWGWRDVRLQSDDERWNGPLDSISPTDTMHFRPHFGWVGHVERRLP